MIDPPPAGTLGGRPGTKALGVASGRAVGGPIQLGLFGAFTLPALAGWLAAAVSLLAAAPQIAAGRPLASRPVLAVHLLALGLLPFAVGAAAFHLLPVMLRNDVHRPSNLRLAVPLLAGGFLVAPAVAYDLPPLLWLGVAPLATGLGLVLVELAGLVRRAPAGRMLVASRSGLALVGFHVLAALVLGALVFAHGDRSFGGVVHERWLLVHLHLAVLGWLTLLIVTVGRTLGPMLAQAPAAPARRLPVAELVLSGGLWLLVAGLAAASSALVAAGAFLELASLARFGVLIARIAGTRRVELEGPLAHFLTGALFLLQAAGIGLAVLAGGLSEHRGLTAYVVFLLLGWAAGVTLGHLGKLLSLSVWVWWPPGPRPKQSALYPRRTWLAEAAAFAAGVELLGLGALVGSSGAARSGGTLLVLAALLAAAGAAATWSRRPASQERSRLSP
jgi:hypothetical protein